MTLQTSEVVTITPRHLLYVRWLLHETFCCVANVASNELVGV